MSCLADSKRPLQLLSIKEDYWPLFGIPRGAPKKKNKPTSRGSPWSDDEDGNQH